jgi:hypothetical protein
MMVGFCKHQQECTRKKLVWFNSFSCLIVIDVTDLTLKMSLLKLEIGILVFLVKCKFY